MTVDEFAKANEKYHDMYKCDVFELVNRQKAEIENLNKTIKRLNNMQLKQLRYVIKLKKRNERLEEFVFDAFEDGYTQAQKYREMIVNKRVNDALKKFAMKVKCGVPQETGVIRCKDVDDTLEELLKLSNLKLSKWEGDE